MITRESVPPKLLEDVKNYINVTWSDPATDDKVCGLIANSTAYLDGKLGGEPDYEADGMPRELLFERVRYGWSEALDVFETIYRAAIRTGQEERVIGAYVEGTTPTA